jgi:DNA-binding transcriptional MerR regulator
MTTLREYVKVGEAALVRGVSETTLRAWAEAGKIPVHRRPANAYQQFKGSHLAKFLQTVERQAKRPR